MCDVEIAKLHLSAYRINYIDVSFSARLLFCYGRSKGVRYNGKAHIITPCILVKHYNEKKNIKLNYLCKSLECQKKRVINNSLMTALPRFPCNFFFNSVSFVPGVRMSSHWPYYHCVRRYNHR